MLTDFNFNGGAGENQRRINPGLLIGAEVYCVPNDVDLIVTDFTIAQTGLICAYWQGSYVEVEMHSGKTYTLNIDQVSTLVAQ